jgi:hypothetical protein
MGGGGLIAVLPCEARAGPIHSEAVNDRLMTGLARALSVYDIAGCTVSSQSAHL